MAILDSQASDDCGNSLETCKTWPKREFDADRICQLRALLGSDKYVALNRRATSALREGWGFLDGSGGNKYQNYSLNTFYGCAFNCMYCYVPKTMMIHHGGPGHDLWGKYVYNKYNMPILLERKLRSMKRNGMLDRAVIRVSSTTDVYQPLETQALVTRNCLKKIVENSPRWTFLQTKSTLILRDLDVLERIKDKLIICITVTTNDDMIGRLFEPHAPFNSSRIKVIQQLKAAGFNVETMIAPILPQDTESLAKRLEPIVDRVFIKSFYETGKSGNKLRDEAYKIIFDNEMSYVLTEKFGLRTLRIFREVFNDDRRIIAGKDDFLNLDYYEA